MYSLNTTHWVCAQEGEAFDAINRLFCLVGGLKQEEPQVAKRAEQVFKAIT